MGRLFFSPRRRLLSAQQVVDRLTAIVQEEGRPRGEVPVKARSMEMIIVGRAGGLDRNKGGSAKDEEGPAMANALGQKIAWLMKTLHRAVGLKNEFHQK